jgi:hypothetical protein
MPAVRAPSSVSGNGSHRWLKELVAKIEQITSRLQDLTKRIKSQPNPTAADVAAAHDLVMRLVSAIEEQILPRRWELAHLASASGLARGLDAALDTLEQSGQEALRAIDVYKTTLEHEQDQRSNERRSNTRYSSDQNKLHRLRQDAAKTTANLIKASAGFARAMSL